MFYLKHTGLLKKCFPIQHYKKVNVTFLYLENTHSRGDAGVEKRKRTLVLLGKSLNGARNKLGSCPSSVQSKAREEY